MLIAQSVRGRRRPRRENRDGRVARLRRVDVRDHVFARRSRCSDGIRNGNGRIVRAYSSRGAAERAADQLAANYTADPMRAYACSCGRWHLTSQEKR